MGRGAAGEEKGLVPQLAVTLLATGFSCSIISKPLRVVRRGGLVRIEAATARGAVLVPFGAAKVEVREVRLLFL